MEIRKSLETISAITASFVIGSVLYTNSIFANEIINTKEKMPEIRGERKITERLKSKDGKIEIEVRVFSDKKANMYITDHLVCDGVVEKNPYTVYVIRKISNSLTGTLYLDFNRDKLIDSGGKLTGKALVDYVEKNRDGINPPIINVAPKCP